MGFEQLKRDVCEANKGLVEAGLVMLTWGNVSGVDRASDVMAIKPSGVGYDELTPDDVTVLSIKTGEVIEGILNPSIDSPTHLVLYREFESIGSVVHVHSIFATSWAQAGQEIPCFGTTHADHFHGPVPLTRALTDDEIKNQYEHNTGRVIVERFAELGLGPLEMSAVLVQHHGPFIWGDTIKSAMDNAVALEEVAGMAALVLQLDSKASPCSKALLDKHYLRKHSPGAYYGQRGKS